MRGISYFDYLARKFPINEREANWNKHWSKWTNKTRQQVIEMTYDLSDLGKFQEKFDEIIELKQQKYKNY